MQPDDIKVQFPDGSPVILRPVAEQSPTFYVNNATFGLTQWDIRVELSELQGVAVKEEDIPVALITRKVKLVMTPSYAKVFANTLLKHVSNYDEMVKKSEEETAKPNQSAPVKDPEPSSE